MPRGWDEFVDHAQVDRRPVGGDFDRRRAAGQRAVEEGPSSTGSAALGYQDVESLDLSGLFRTPGPLPPETHP
jgi:hypothetical protein